MASFCFGHHFNASAEQGNFTDFYASAFASLGTGGRYSVPIPVVTRPFEVW